MCSVVWHQHYSLLGEVTGEPLAYGNEPQGWGTVGTIFGRCNSCHVSKGCPDWLMFSSDGQVTELAISHHAAPTMQMKADVWYWVVADSAGLCHSAVWEEKGGRFSVLGDDLGTWLEWGSVFFMIFWVLVFLWCFSETLKAPKIFTYPFIFLGVQAMVKNAPR